ncbi:conserved hypothetical protein [Gammaproteobacteria bacterium]
MESAKDRYVRFNKAKEKSSIWRAKLAPTYKLVFPYKNYFNTRGQAPNSTAVWDMTAVVAAHDFANNFQTIMLPPHHRWANLTRGIMLTEELEAMGGDIKGIDEKFQKMTETVFQCINSSNFSLAIHEALLDFCVGTGVILINETNDSSIIDVHSVPIDDICFEEGRFDNLENFWRVQKLTKRQILRNWPEAELNERMGQEENQDKEFELIEGSIYYPEKADKEHDGKDPNAYYYYIQEQESQKEIFHEWRDYCPFIGFRYSRSPGDPLGHGLAEFALSFIKVVNEIAELDLQALQFKTQSPYLYDPKKLQINPSTFNLEPGTFFPVDLSSGAPSVMPFPLPNESRFSRLSIAELQKTIKDIFLSSWIDSNMRTPNMTATEVSIRQQEFTRRIGGAIGRFAQEFIKPFLTACLKILRRKGKLPDLIDLGQYVVLKINNQFINIEYDSPLAELQKQHDVDTVLSFIAMNVQLFQGNAMLALNMPEIPMWLANKKGVALELVNSPATIKKEFENMKAALQKQEQPPEPQALPLQQPQIAQLHSIEVGR